MNSILYYTYKLLRVGVALGPKGTPESACGAAPDSPQEAPRSRVLVPIAILHEVNKALEGAWSNIVEVSVV